MPRMTNEEAAAMLESMKNYFLPTSPMLEERREITALDLAISALSKQSASSEQVDKSVIVDFVAFQREWLNSHKTLELDAVNNALVNIFLETTGKAFINSLSQSVENDEDGTSDNEGPKLFGNRTIIEPGEQFIGEDLLKEALDQCGNGTEMVELKKRTITERLIIAESLINSVIADSDQFREDTKMTDSERVSLLEQEKSNSFSKELSEEVVHEMNCIPTFIRCKDCRWWDKYGDYDNGYCMAAKHGYFSNHWEVSIRRKYKGNFYCADAEPKGEQA